MEGIWPIIFLLVVLKIPVFGGMYLVWYAVQAEPEVEEGPPPGSDDHHFRRWRTQPRRPTRGPRGPRRGDHGGGAIAVPERPLPTARRDSHRARPAGAPATRR